MFSKLCEPTPTAIPDTIQRELMHRRNKCVSIILITSFFSIFLFAAFLRDFKDPVSIKVLLTSIALNILFFLTCRTHPRHFYTIYALLLASWSPAWSLLSELGGFSSWTTVFMVPCVVLFITGSRLQFLIHGVLQAVYLYCIQKPSLEFAISYYGVEEFISQLINMTIIGFGLMLACIYLIHSNQNIMLKKAILGESQREEAKRQKILLLSFSHEMRNLLNSMIGNIDLCFLHSLTEMIAENLKIARTCAELLLQEVNNVLDSGKAEVDELEINMKPVVIRDIISNVWRVCSERIKKKNLNGSLIFHQMVPKTVVVDDYRLTQILMNLIGNATKFTENGFIDLTVEWISDKEQVDDEVFSPIPFEDGDGIFEKNQALLKYTNEFTVCHVNGKSFLQNPSISLENQKGILKITVRDTGCGISSENIPKLFQKFTQVGELSRRKLGTGLGLFISKKLVNMMHGEIRAFSKLTEGSAFVFCLPLEVKSDQILTSSPPLSTSALNLHAMIVDDESFNIKVLTTYFEKLSIQNIHPLSDGDEAVSFYIQQHQKRVKINIITMDIHMRRMDGKTAAKKIREYEKENNIEPSTIIMISANISQSEIKECLEGEIRANEFLKKPVKYEELGAVMDELLTKSF